jgi:hypothetical protein
MVISGIAYWSSLITPNTTYEPCYCIDVEVDESTSALLMEAGLKPKMVDGRSRYKIKRKAFRKDGSPAKKPVVLDKNGQPFNELIGNGSLVQVQTTIENWKWGAKSGVRADLQGVKVLELVSYKMPDGAELMGSEPTPTVPTDDELFSE